MTGRRDGGSWRRAGADCSGNKQIEQLQEKADQ
jgi:hypothetical protein